MKKRRPKSLFCNLEHSAGLAAIPSAAAEKDRFAAAHSDKSGPSPRTLGQGGVGPAVRMGRLRRRIGTFISLALKLVFHKLRSR
jgi:hypothetical protein